jgi:hypothetical protein
MDEERRQTETNTTKKVYEQASQWTETSQVTIFIAIVISLENIPPVTLSSTGPALCHCKGLDIRLINADILTS